MDQKEAKLLVERCLPRFAIAGLPELDAGSITSVQAKPIASMWAGMGTIYKLSITYTAPTPARAGQAMAIVAKRVQLPARCSSIGDQRKKDSYDVEAAFYSEGHAERLLAAGCQVPFPLHIEHSRGEGLTICMSYMEGSNSARNGTEAFVLWLARMHAMYWGSRADEACAKAPGGGLWPQGCYWHLDTRPDEHKRMGSSGWMGRLRLAARAIDLRLKADPLQSICHGDAKGANITFAAGEDGSCIPLVCDFQYCGKGACTKDLAYFFNVEAYCSASEEASLLGLYYKELSKLLAAQEDSPPTFEALSTSLELALCDWRRFTEIGLGGWGDGGANARVKKVLDRLDGGKALESEQAYIEAMQREFPV